MLKNVSHWKYLILLVAKMCNNFLIITFKYPIFFLITMKAQHLFLTLIVLSLLSSGCIGQKATEEQQSESTETPVPQTITAVPTTVPLTVVPTTVPPTVKPTGTPVPQLPKGCVIGDKSKGICYVGNLASAPEDSKELQLLKLFEKESLDNDNSDRPFYDSLKDLLSKVDWKCCYHYLQKPAEKSKLDD